MKYLLLLVLMSTFLGCNSKKNDARSKIRNPNPKKEVLKKLDVKEIVNGLDKLGYFKLTDSIELDEVKADFEKSYTDLNFFKVQCEEKHLTLWTTDISGSIVKSFSKLEA